MSVPRNGAIFLAWTASSAAWFFAAGVTLFIGVPAYHDQRWTHHSSAETVLCPTGNCV